MRDVGVPLLIPTVHPAAVLRDQTMQFALEEDLKKAVRVQREGATVVPPPIMDWQWKPTRDEVRAWLVSYDDGYPISCDFEGTLDGKVVCLGLWPTNLPCEEHGICIPFLRQGGFDYWPIGEHQEVLSLVMSFLTDPARPKVGQNIVGYDFGYYPWNAQSLAKRAWGIDVRGILGDTMVAHHLCFPELRHGLAFQASISTDLPPYKLLYRENADKEEEKGAKAYAGILNEPDEKTRTYCLNDAFATAVIWNELERMMA